MEGRVVMFGGALAPVAMACHAFVAIDRLPRIKARRRVLSGCEASHEVASEQRIEKLEGEPSQRSHLGHSDMGHSEIAKRDLVKRGCWRSGFGHNRQGAVRREASKADEK